MVITNNYTDDDFDILIINETLMFLDTHVSRLLLVPVESTSQLELMLSRDHDISQTQ